jgi:hypothetical protein
MGKEESTRSRSVKRQSWQRYLKKHWGQKLMCTSKKSTDILEVVKVLIYASKVWDLLLETDSKNERHLRHFYWVSVGGPAVLRGTSYTFAGFMSEVLLF